MKFKVVVNPIPEGTNNRVLSWNIVPSTYKAQTNEFVYSLDDMDEEFPMQFHTYVVDDTDTLVGLVEDHNDNIIEEADWDNTDPSMLERLHTIVA